MALLFMDSFDHFVGGAASDTYEKWTGWSGGGGGGATTPAVVGGGRNGNGLNLSGSNYEAEIYKTLVDRDTWVVGWAFRMAAIGQVGMMPIFVLQDASLAGQCSVYCDPSVGQFALYRGQGSAQLATSTTGLISGNQWMYLEIKAYLHDTLGTLEFRRNGQTLMTYSGDSKQTANAYGRTVRFLGDRTQTGTTTIDDVYVLDGVDSGIPGCPNNDFLGDCRVEARFPSGVGTTTEMVRSGTDSGQNWSQVDEAAPNDATDMVETDVVGAKDTYQMSDLATVAGTVYAVQACPNARKNDAGTRGFKNVIRSDGVEEEGIDQFLGTSFTMYREIFESDPSGNQWTIASINAMEAGVKVSI